ncbi:MAG: Ku protein [Chitinophagaceae bacterium]|nr:MAG: Ku protein [Chitinophagaceae bacterium]
MRAIWSGAIGFGLVNIPIKLFSATESSSLDLDMLDKSNNSNIRFARINKDTGEEVAWKDIVKGYKYEGEYVVLSDEDFQKVSPKKSKMIDIEEFVEEPMVDAAFHDTPYYIEPAKGGEKAYALLREALKETGKVALGRYIMRTKENFCMLRAHENILMLVKLRFPEEIRDYSELNIPSERTAIKPAELKMATALIDQLTPKKFNIEKYKDTYDKELLKIIKAKAGGKKVAEPKFKMVTSKSKDLMQQLKESLESGSGSHKKAS